MFRAARRRAAKKAIRDAKGAAAKRSAVAASERRQNLAKKCEKVPSLSFRAQAYEWGRECMRTLWEREIWPWRIAFRVGARVVGVDPDEKVKFGRGKPRA
jgi:hypothetical protein